ncbi:hypothetical protein A0256_23095 [Mucilaginibacter sp. PAMC 26640]|nr:hypothetical protein A0256_23095 [Mucilaginibacter sp. PAMC 26640]
MYLPIYFNGEILSQLPVYPSLPIDWQLMGAKEIKADIELPGVLVCPIGSYIFYKGKQYTVNTIPSVTAGTGVDAYKYTITFESDFYRLYDKKLKHLKNKTFQYYGSPADFAQLIVDNVNEIDSGWTVGACDAAAEKAINFDGHTCRTAMDTVAEAFGFEWPEDGKVISFVKQVGNLTTHVFERGMGKGLYSLGYEYQNDKNIVTRAFGYGSKRNLPQDYRSGATELMFSELSLDKNTSLYRVKEGDYINEDIYPKINGLVTGVSAFDANAEYFFITDSTLNFNLKDYFSSETPKISFLTGELEGQEFDILDYAPDTKTIKVKVFTDSSNNKQPNSVFQAAANDTYTLFDMFLPTERVTAAENELRVATQAWLDENSVPRVLYSLEMDPLYARDNGIMLQPGDKVTVKDTALGINSLIRVTSINYPINFPETITPETKITVQIANFIPYTTTERLISSAIDNKQDIKLVDRTNAERARRASYNLKSLQTRIFNPDGSLFTGVNSLVAGMGTFGYDSQNFNLNNVLIVPNAGGNPNTLNISLGSLTHYIYKVDGLGYVWNIPSNASFTGLDPAKFYFIYAKCNKAALTGTWGISISPVGVNDIAGYYAFNLGLLYEVKDGFRDFDLTKGITTIVGDRIKTGEISSIDGVTKFNLNTGTITGRIQFASGSSGYNQLTDKPDLSHYADFSYIDAIKDELQNQIDGQLTNWFYDYEPSLSNAPANSWTTDDIRNTHLGDLFYWTSKGYAYRFAKDAGTGAYSWIAITNVDIILALQRAATAQDTADGKRRVFTTTPVAPYDPGDLWAGGTSSDLKVCVTARAAGYGFNSADWPLATKYTDDTTANAALAAAADANNFVIAVRDSLQNQIDGQITSWFYDYQPTLSNAPTNSWTTDGTKDIHLGDLFYWTSKGYAYRFAKVGSVYSWMQISDTDVVLALTTANAAKDTADGKRRVFVTTPVTPYDAGDLWAGGSGADLKRCIVSRASGAYNAADWDLATKYTDDTLAYQASLDAASAIANASNAQSTANRAATVTDGLFTIIDGNIVATGTVIVGDATHINAGLTGVTDNGVNSIRQWAGATYANRATAPFRVTDAGDVVMTSAQITGLINAVAGKIANWTIDSMGLKNTSNTDAYIVQEKTNSSGTVEVRAAMGTAININTLVGEFINHKPNSAGANKGISVSVTGGTWKTPMLAGTTGNIAAELEGDLYHSGGKIITNGVLTYTGNVGYMKIDGSSALLRVTNGLITAIS